MINWIVISLSGFFGFMGGILFYKRFLTEKPPTELNVVLTKEPPEMGKDTLYTGKAQETKANPSKKRKFKLFRRKEK